MVEGVGGIVGSQAVIVQAEVGLAAGYGAVALVELQAHGTGNALLSGGHEGIYRMLQRAEPLAVVHHGCPVVLQVQLVAQNLALQAHVLKAAMGNDEGQGARCLVALTALNADHAVLDHVDAAEAVVAGDLVHLGDDVQVAHLLAVDGNRQAALELDLNLGGLVGSLLGVGGHGVDVQRRAVHRVFQNTALDGAAPQVVVDGVRLGLGGGNGYAVSLCPVHFLLAGVHIPLANRGDDLQRGVQRLDGGLEANLVVALAGAAMGHVLGTELMGGVYQVLGDQRAGKGGYQRVLVLEVGVGEQGLGQVVGGEVLAHVGDDAVHRTRSQRALLNLLQAFVLLTYLAHNGDNVEVLLVLKPLDANAGVQAARVGEYAFILCHLLTFLLALFLC